MDAWQSQPITLERQASVEAKASASHEGVALIVGNEVWVFNALMTPSDAIAVGQSLLDGAVQARAMGAKP